MNNSLKKQDSEVAANAVYKRRCLSLQKGCEEIQQENFKLANRIYQVKKIVKRLKRERTHMLHQLANQHGNDSTDFESKPPANLSETANINNSTFTGSKTI